MAEIIDFWKMTISNYINNVFTVVYLSDSIDKTH